MDPLVPHPPVDNPLPPLPPHAKSTSRPNTVPHAGFSRYGTKKPTRTHPTLGEETRAHMHAMKRHTVDTWPAAAGRSAGGTSQQGAKPALLRHMEEFLSKELAMLNITATGKKDPPIDSQTKPPSLEKIQVYRQAFQMFVDHFKVYGGILCSILKVYEDGLQWAMTQAMRIPKLEADVAVATRHCEGEVQALKHDLQAQIRKLTQDKIQAQKTLETKVNEERRSFTELEALRRQTELYEREKKEDYDRTLLLINAVKEAQDRHQETYAQMQTMKEESNIAQELAQSSVKELQTMRGLMSENVPMKEFERMGTELEEAKTRLTECRHDLQHHQRLLSRVKEKYEELSQSMEKLKEENESLRESANLTPRPELGDLDDALKSTLLKKGSTGQIVSHLHETIQQMTQEKKVLESDLLQARQKLDWIQESKDVDTGRQQARNQGPPPEKNFAGLGTGSSVPKYLKWHGKIKNKNMSKRDLEHFLKEFWKEKQKLDEKREVKTTMEEYFYTHLQQRYGMHQVIVEWAYNIVEACKRFKWDADCELFLTVLEGRLSEQVFHDQIVMINKLKTAALALEIAPNKQKTGKIKKKAFLDMLVNFFPTKSEGDMIKVKWALTKDLATSSEVDVHKLFAEDRDGNQTAFVEMVRDQMVKETIEYIAEIQQGIYNKGNFQSAVSLAQAKEGILAVDPKKPEKEIENMLNRGVGKPDGSKVAYDMVVDLDSFLAAMKEGPMARSTKARPQAPTIG
eukprot:TRINITY_DN62008_c0_g1_i1.p1 TRINITY_DN62008_c0_g1~~TRINITY_DN62008_c0_g1_i1.p1  ORF type:complete len:742 (-),score=78.05 TRINITY_DN62008_c0_g1_i1:1144-3369(-)